MATPRDALLVFLGGGIGSVLRFFAASALPKTQSGGFALAILLVNIAGCFALGALLGYIAWKDEPHKLLLTFAGVGVCGGFTTFSTFGVDALELLREGRLGSFCAYVGLSVVLGIAAAFAGFKSFGILG
jgi:CrcB protein